MANSWLTFLADFRKKNPKLSVVEAAKKASAEYKKKKPKADMKKPASKAKGKGKKMKKDDMEEKM